MPLFVGLDVSQNETAIAIVDETGRRVLETAVSTDPNAVTGVFDRLHRRFERVGLEAGMLSQWLHNGIKAHGYPVVCIENQRMHKFASASPGKTDRSDAMAIAQAMRAGLYRPVHVKSEWALQVRTLLVHRRKLLHQAQDLERMLRGTLKTFGLRIGPVTAKNFPSRVADLLRQAPALEAIVEPVVKARRHLVDLGMTLHRLAKAAAKAKVEAMRLMTVPGVGPITALAFVATIDDPARFKRSREIGAHLGLVPRLHESGEVSWRGRVTRHGDIMLRRQLFLAARSHIVNYRGETDIGRWGRALWERRGFRRAMVAVSRKLSVVLLAMWRDRTEFRPKIA